MVQFTKPLKGIQITEEPVAEETPVEATEKPFYRNASGRTYKAPRVPTRTQEVHFTSFTLEEKLKKRQEKNEMMQLQKELVEEKKEEYAKRKAAREAKKERQRINEEKGLQNVQVIKDTNKIRKWSKKAQAKLMKMPKDMFEKYLKNSK